MFSMLREDTFIGKSCKACINESLSLCSTKSLLFIVSSAVNFATDSFAMALNLGSITLCSNCSNEP